ncbi:MAG: hypothetical protein NTY13_04885 [Chlamydiae bacterium]|nr:hypothetical protein [Chlamydiota bacterium]
MSQDLLDIYSNYLIAQSQYATATGLSTLLNGDLSHDKITRFLNKNEYSSKDLWIYVKPKIRELEEDKGGVLILDDTIEEQPYTDENKINCWHLIFFTLLASLKIETILSKVLRRVPDKQRNFSSFSPLNFSNFIALQIA